MSSRTPAEDSSTPPPTPPQSRRARITRALSKVKNSISRRHSRIGSTSENMQNSAPASAPVAAVDLPATIHAPVVAGPADSRICCEQLEIDDGAPDLSEPSPMPPMVTIQRGASAQDRARIRASEFNIDFDSLGGRPFHDDGPSSGVSRVQKKIKMRVRHSCHKCSTMYTVSRLCQSCGHNRCHDCPREPTRRRTDRTEQTVRAVLTHAQLEGPSIPVQTIQPETSSVTLVPIVHRSANAPGRPVQRVQHFCHLCESPFVAGTAQYCPDCGHSRCDICPNKLSRPVLPPQNLQMVITVEPQTSESRAKERVWRGIRQRIRWSCHECKTTFKTGEKTCSNCKHIRCHDCSRAPSSRSRMAAPPRATIAEAAQTLS